jgi:hypothetical protein
MSDGSLDTQKPENLRTIYRELCSSYRAIDDFRTKLLGFLPLVTGTGLFFLVTDKAKIDMAQPYFGPIGVFGFVITLGLFFYEFYGIKKCGSLITAGIELEKELKIGDGQFTKRPPGVLGLINEPLAAGVIYPAVLAAWIFVALAFSQYQSVARRWAIFVFLIGFAVSFSYNLKFDSNRKRSKVT